MKYYKLIGTTENYLKLKDKKNLHTLILVKPEEVVHIKKDIFILKKDIELQNNICNTLVTILISLILVLIIIFALFFDEPKGYYIQSDNGAVHYQWIYTD